MPVLLGAWLCYCACMYIFLVVIYACVRICVYVVYGCLFVSLYYPGFVSLNVCLGLWVSVYAFV